MFYAYAMLPNMWVGEISYTPVDRENTLENFPSYFKIIDVIDLLQNLISWSY